MKLFFLWPRLRHDIARRVRDQAPKTFHDAIQIAQIIESAVMPDITATPAYTTAVNQQTEHGPSPMDIDVQNAQFGSRRQLSHRDAQGRPRCFHYNIYDHIRHHCRKSQLHNHNA
ncbi:hypothetical protein KP509_27G049900 [Ceratopteris richardii]|uniref:Uncharacterized protein n=1 Tax=Ceratopteris richardii TaxID=49495 RepID=A0A8T2RIV3_CERRI|nr:hypothetical protein KP509_27G049900 [Ceratopteris richardii]